MDCRPLLGFLSALRINNKNVLHTPLQLLIGCTGNVQQKISRYMEQIRYFSKRGKGGLRLSEFIIGIGRSLYTEKIRNLLLGNIIDLAKDSKFFTKSGLFGHPLCKIQIIFHHKNP